MTNKSIHSSAKSAILSPELAARKLLKATETAEILGIDVQTLYNWNHSRKYPELKCVKVGSSLRYRPEDVEAFIAVRTR